MSRHAELLRLGAERLRRSDPTLLALLDDEISYQSTTLSMAAYASLPDPSVLAAAGSALGSVTAEGYPGARYHPGTAQFDAVERLAADRATRAFGAQYANLQPYSCSAANLAVLFALLEPGGVLLSLDLDSGGHLTHGAPASVTSRHFRVVHYGLGADGRISYDQAADLAREHRPELIIAGASAYPRAVDYTRFREIADSVGAYLLADISHVAGLVAAGLHPSPVDVAHVTTTSTYKQLGGPRGGIILLGVDRDLLVRGHGRSLEQVIRRGVFPAFQGTPNPAAIAAKARALDLVTEPAFAETARRIVANARELAAELTTRGWRLLTGGTDNHMVLLDVARRGITGAVAQSALQECDILANKNRIPGDPRSPQVTSGLRLGANILAQRGMRPSDMATCATLVHDVLRGVETRGDQEHRLPGATRQRVRARVRELCRDHPVPSYPAEA